MFQDEHSSLSLDDRIAVWPITSISCHHDFSYYDRGVYLAIKFKVTSHCDTGEVKEIK